MEDKICLDTDFLVDFLRNKKEEVDFVLENESKAIFATTYINLFELYYGAYKYNIKENILKLEDLFFKLNILNLSKDAVKKAGEILVKLEKDGNRLDFRDLLIGCTAMTEGFIIKTNNKKHFQRIPGLIVI